MNSQIAIRFATLIPIALLALTAASFGHTAHAYGPANWQVTEAGTFVNPGQAHFGFWGWCSFSGGTSAGSAADCELELYSGPDHSLQVHESISGTAWDMELATIRPQGPGITPNDFYITDGTMSITSSNIATGPPPPGGPPPGCFKVGATATCPLSVWEAAHVYDPDTGIPAAAGHYNLNSMINGVGELQFQVNQIR